MLSALKNENGPFAGPVPCVSRTRLRREGRAASTARLRLRIDEREAARQPLLDVVERRAIQVEIALLVDDDLDPVDLELLVVRPDLAVELQGVREPGAAAPFTPIRRNTVSGRFWARLSSFTCLAAASDSVTAMRSLPPIATWTTPGRPRPPAFPGSRPARP